jgi:DNA polymerase III delta prime subunit
MLVMIKRKQFFRNFLIIAVFLFIAFLTVLLAYLGNQIPALKDLPGIKEFAEKQDPWAIFYWMVLAAIGSSLVLALLTTWGFPFILASGKSGATIVTELDSGQRQRLIKSQLAIVEKRLADMLERSVSIPLGFEDAGEQLGADRTPLEILQRVEATAPARGLFRRVKEWMPFGQGRAVTFPAQTRMIEVFRHPEVSGRLLILGSPGAGKTTTLLELARELMEEAKEDDSKPLPYWFEMAGWTAGQSLGDYLSAELNLDRAVGRVLIDSGRVLPLLDGLDELRDVGLIRSGMAAINEFLGDGYGQRDAVVCCRTRDYELAQEQLTALNGAVQLQPLTKPQIEAYLEHIGKTRLWEQINQVSEMQQLLDSVDDHNEPGLLRMPLFISLAAQVFEEGTPLRGKEDLLDRYIQQKLKSSVQEREVTIHKLAWIAKQLKRHRQVELRIEDIQPSWLNSVPLKKLYEALVSIVIILSFVLVSGKYIVILLSPLLGFIIARKKIVLVKKPVKIARRNIAYLGMVYPDHEGEKVDNLLKRMPVSIFGFLVIAISAFFWSIFGFLVFPYFFQVHLATIEKIFLSAIFALIPLAAIFLADLRFRDSQKEMQTESAPNQGMKETLNNIFSLGPVAYVLGILLRHFSEISTCIAGGNWLKILSIIFSIQQLPAIFALYICLFVLGGGSVVQHLCLRLILFSRGDISWNYTHFLEKCVENKILQRTDGRYRFIHRELLDHMEKLS